MQKPMKNQLDQAVKLVDEARRQIEVEVTALNLLLKEEKIEIDEYTKCQAASRQEKAKRIYPEIANVLAYAHTPGASAQARYLKAAYDHLATGQASLEAFSWKAAQQVAELHTQDAYRREKDEERDAINREAQVLTLEDLLPKTSEQ